MRPASNGGFPRSRVCTVPHRGSDSRRPIGRRSVRLSGQRGDATSVGNLWAIPFVLLMVFATVEGGVLFHSRNVALTAAEQGVREGRIAGSAEAGVAAAEEFLAGNGGGIFDAVTVSSQGSTAEIVRITVQGTVPSFFPGLPAITFAQTAAGAVERPRP